MISTFGEDEHHNIDDELKLFEREIAALETETQNDTITDTEHSPSNPNLSSVSSSPDSPTSKTSTTAQPAPQPIGPTMQSETRPVMGPFLNNSGVPNTSNSSVRPTPPPFLPHMMMRPGFIPQPNLGMRFIPPQLRLPLVGFMRPPLQMSIQPVILESGPSMYDDSVKGADMKSGKKNAVIESNPMKTQVLASDVEAIAQKKFFEAAHRSTYINQVMRGERKMKRFLRCGGGQVWEDKSLAEWDPNDFRIFCGDLGNEVSDELLAKAFRKYPSFQKAKVIREARTNKSKGYGFVSFKHQDDFVRACREMDGKYVGNRPIKLRKSNWRERNMEVVKKKKKQKQKLGLS